MKKLLLLPILILMLYAKNSVAQQTTDTPITNFVPQPQPPKVIKAVTITGRILGINLENVQEAIVINKRTNEKVSTDSRGIYQVTAAKGDTLIFQVAKYSKEQIIVKSIKDNLNIVMIKRKADNLPAGYSKSEYEKAQRDDNELYRILEKDAKLEGKWNY